MPTDTIFHTTTLVTRECGECGCIHAFTQGFIEQRKRDKQLFYCPNGHARHFSESEADRLRAANAKLTSELDQAKSSRDFWKRDADDKSKKLNRLKKRVGNGVCPCCNRTVSQLAAHMKSKHPDFKAPDAPAKETA